MKYLELEDKVKSFYTKLNPIYKKAFLISFALINLAFLFHTINFMFGDHDWNYVRSANYWSEGSFEGRPLHFVLQSLLFNGQVVPILNNLVSFAALALSGLLLAHYWRIPLTTFNYVLFATFIAVLPFTMVWLFYAKDMLINLSLPLFVVLGLLTAEKKTFTSHLIAVALFYFAFSSYAAVIDMLGICFIGKLLIEYIEHKNLKELCQKAWPVILDVIMALVLFELTIKAINIKAEYNTKTLSVADWPQKLGETFVVMFSQFITPIPFMEPKYKYLLLALCVFGVGAAFKKGGFITIPTVVLFVLAMLFVSKFAYFIADERGQVLAEMENFAFVPRLDFYGLAYIYALGLALVLSYTKDKWYKTGAVVAVALTFMSMVRDAYAAKVWKLGFDAEMKAHERIVGRLEQHKDFRLGKKYRLLQVGSISMRKNYYREVSGEQTSLDLLTTSFTPQYMSRIVYNFYYPKDMFYNNASVADLSPQGKDYLRYAAKSWPSNESIFIDGDIVILVLTDEGLNKARQKLD